MIITKRHLSRRTFLRGAFGTMVAVPFLDAMIPALSGQSKGRPFRFGAVYVPNGIYPGGWHPDKTGSDFEFKPIMAPLEPYRSHLVTISKMKAPDGNPDMGGVHMGATGACDGYPCVFFNTVSWRDDTSPLPMGINPRVTFERMFGETGSSKKRLSNLTRKQKMLDSITEETAALRRKLGPADNAILDEYLSNIRDVEQQLERMESRAAAVPEGAAAPLGIP